MRLIVDTQRLLGWKDVLRLSGKTHCAYFELTPTSPARLGVYGASGTDLIHIGGPFSLSKHGKDSKNYRGTRGTGTAHPRN